MKGEDLEQFVARIERSLLPPGFKVETRVRSFNQDGVQIAEFDVVVTGTAGDGTTVCFCIECRDRPSEGSAPASWIEQLFGRRHRFQFDRVIAVSTTGFAPPAIDYAAQAGIELRAVNTLTPDSLSDWLATEHLEFRDRHIHLAYFKILILPTETDARRSAAERAARRSQASDPVLLNPKTGQMVRPVDAFEVAVSRRPTLWPVTVGEGAWSGDVEVPARYPDNDRYELPTDEGPVPIPEILFRGRLSLRSTIVQFNRAREYVNESTGERIASCATAAFEIDARQYRVDLDQVAVDGMARIEVHLEERG